MTRRKNRSVPGCGPGCACPMCEESRLQAAGLPDDYQPLMAAQPELCKPGCARVGPHRKCETDLAAAQAVDAKAAPKKRAKARAKISVGDAVKIGKAIEWGVEQAYAGKTGEVIRRKACPAGFACVNVAGVGERYIAIKRLRLVKVRGA